MKNVFKKAAGLSVAAGLLCAGSAFASPLSTTTSSLFLNDKDDIGNVINWSNVKFDKWMVAADFDYNNIDVIGAFKKGDLVIVPSLTGNGIYTYFKSTATENVSYTIEDNHPAGSTVTETLDPDGNSKANHSITPGVLVGLGNLGFKFTYGIDNNSYFDFYEPSSGNSGAKNTSTSQYDKDGTLISSTSTEYTKGQSLNITNAPSISAGMKIKAGNVIYKPYAGITTSINSTGILAEKKVTTTETSASSTNYVRDTVNNKVTITPNTGVVIYVPSKNSKLSYLYTADYTGNFNLYGTNYKDAFGNKTHFGTFSGYTKNSSLTNPDGSKESSVNVNGTVGNNAYAYNTLRGTCKVSFNPTDAIHLAARANVSANLNYDSSKTNSVNTSRTVSTDKYGESTVTETTTTGASSKTENFGVRLYSSINAALVYEIKPGKFNLNCGTNLTIPSFSYSTSTTTNPDLEKTTTTTTGSLGTNTTQTVTYADQSASKTDTTTFGNFYTDLYTGFSFFVSENVELDASLWLGITNTGSSIFSSSLTAGCVVKF